MVDILWILQLDHKLIVYFYFVIFLKLFVLLLLADLLKVLR